MGGCKESPDTCTNKTCRGYEVDIMHFSVGNAIPGRLYGGNPIDNRDGNGGDRYIYSGPSLSNSSMDSHRTSLIMILIKYIMICQLSCTGLVIWLIYMLGIHIAETLMEFLQVLF